MKKYLFFALTVAALASSCSSDSDVGSANEAEEPMPIKLTFAQKSMSTRGTGTVGGVTGGENKWHNQIVKVFMLVKDSMKLANFEGTPIYQDQEFLTPGRVNSTPFVGISEGPDSDGIARPVDDKVKYYPPQGKFSFYAYRLDDAITTGPVFTEGQSLKVPFKIDGSQDIMVAKAIPSAADSALLRIGDTEEARNVNVKRSFSAFSARHGVQPTLDFTHELTRLTFHVVPMASNTTNPIGGIVIDSVRILSTTTEGVLTVAELGADGLETLNPYITWTGGTSDTLAIMERDYAHHTEANIDSLNLVKLTEVDLRKRKVGEMISVGEALLLAPQHSYEVFIHMHQTTKSNNTDGLDSNTNRTPYNYKDVIKLKSGLPFKKGTSYDITINLYGLEEIIINTHLTSWEYNPDDDVTIQPEENE